MGWLKRPTFARRRERGDAADQGPVGPGNERLLPAADSRSRLRRAYVGVLTWAFAVLNGIRILAYLPTVWAIHVNGNSSQHSLWTWLTWFGANATMAGWLYERTGQADRAVIINIGNALMCFATICVILAYRR